MVLCTREEGATPGRTHAEWESLLLQGALLVASSSMMLLKTALHLLCPHGVDPIIISRQRALFHTARGVERGGS